MPAWRFDKPMLDEAAITDRIAAYAMKLAWFAKAGYVPHYYQLLFHTASVGDTLERGLCRFRHLVAGRRGGKTLSAAWDVLYYLLHPEEFHWDYHRKKDDTPLYAWALAKDHPTGLASLQTFRKCLRDAGLENGVDYKEHKGNRWFEFPNGSFIHFRSAEDPQSLRGPGLDILWIDEAAFIPNRDALDVARPAMSEKRGMFISTTTPDGKNWLYNTFFQGGVLVDPEHARVEYRSLDNPYFPEEEWVYMANPENYHPLLFRREYLAAFDAMAGKELPGDWLKYWVEETRENPMDLIVPHTPDAVADKPHGYDLDVWLGIDPAISLSDEADRFAITALGVTKGAQGFILDQWAGRIAFPDQIDLIMEWYVRWKPIYIAVEVQAFQRAIEQQLTRIENIPNIIPMFAKGKKEERILSMAPLFKAGKVRINRSLNDFINEWVDYDSTKKNPADDCLDSAEIAIRAAGIWLPTTSQTPDRSNPEFDNFDELAWSRMPKEKSADEWRGVDEHLGGDW
jgi:phage terminase large subunit-like protein